MALPINHRFDERIIQTTAASVGNGVAGVARAPCRGQITEVGTELTPQPGETVLDAEGRVTRIVELGEGAFGIALRGERLFVSDWYGARLRCLTLAGDHVWTAPTGKAPAGVALSGDGRIVAVADRDDDRLSAYDAATGGLVWQAGQLQQPSGVGWGVQRREG